MRLLKRIASAAVAAALSLTMFTACGEKEDYGKDVIKLRWVTYESSVPPDVKDVIKEANEYSAEKIGVVVDLEFQPTEMINLTMASGEYYDIIFTCSWLNNYNTAASRGMFYDITDLVQTATPDLYNVIGEYWDASEINGRYYGVPTLKDMGSEMMFRMNATYYEDEKGMTIPEEMKFEDLEPFLEAYKKDNPIKYPLAMDKSGIAGFLNFLEKVVDNYIVIPYDSETPEIMPIWENEEFMKRVRLLHKWYQLGYINPDAAAMDYSGIAEDTPIRTGVAWRGYTGYSNPAYWDFRVKLSLYDGPYISKFTEQGAMFAISAGCDEKHAEASLKYLELLNTDRKFRDILAYGIEGRHFNYLSNGTVMKTDEGTDGYMPSLFTTGSVTNASVLSVSEDYLSDPELWTKVFEGYKEYGIWSKSGGFIYDTKRKEDIVTMLSAIWSNYYTDMITGTSDPDVIIPKMKKEMEDAGLEELMDDIKSEFEKHLAENK